MQKNLNPKANPMKIAVFSLSILCITQLFAGVTEDNWTRSATLQHHENGAYVLEPGKLSGTLLQEIDPVIGIHQVDASVYLDGVQCAGIGLGKKSMSGAFFRDAVIALVIASNGQYEITIKGKGKVVQGNRYSIPAMVSDEPYRLSLIYNSMDQTVSASINSAPILQTQPLSGFDPPIEAAAVTLNGRISEARTEIVNAHSFSRAEASSGFSILSAESFVVAPYEHHDFTWNMASHLPGRPISFAISDYAGKRITTGEAAILDDSQVQIGNLSFDPGTYIIEFSGSRERFGVISWTPATLVDPFFCMDAGMAWLEPSQDRQDEFIRILKRAGIALVRERMNMASLYNACVTGAWEGKAGNRDRLRQSYGAFGPKVLELLWGMNHKMGPVQGSDLPTQLVATSNATRSLIERWDHSADGYEVWNEPNLKDLPSDQYASLCHTY